MAKLSIRVRTQKAALQVQRLRKALEPRAIDRLIALEAAITHARIVQLTPKGYTGNTRRQWRYEKTPSGWRVINEHKVMKFLEGGTRAHGAKGGKSLYIPLNRAAAIGGWHRGLRYGVDYVLAKRVKGIKALHIVRDEKVKTRERLRLAFIQHLKNNT